MTVQVPFAATDQTYPFNVLRLQMGSVFTSPGTVHPGDMVVSPSSGLQVQISSGSAYVLQTVEPEGAFYAGAYFVYNDAPTNPANTILAPVSNPRWDMIVLRVYDVNEQGLSGSSKAQFEWVTGTENAAASITNIVGLGAVPANSLVIAYVLQTVGESSVSAGNIVSAGSVAATAHPNPIDAIQNGIVNTGDLALSAISLASGTGVLTFTVAAGTAWVKTQSGLLVRIAPAQQSALSPTPTLPASTKYAVVGVEIDPNGTVTLVKGTDTGTQLNTGSLIAANSPAVTSGKLRIADFAIWNNAGVYNFSDHTTTASQGVNWIDRRPWARGAKFSAGFSSWTWPSSGTYVAVSNLIRLECTGVPLRIRLAPFQLVLTAAPTYSSYFAVTQDGVGIGGTTATLSPDVQFYITSSFGQNAIQTNAIDKVMTPAAGSHTFQVIGYNQGAISGFNSSEGWSFEEILQNANNGTA